MDRISKNRRSWNMSRIKNRDTKPELKVRRLLYAKGYRYRVNYRARGRPDIAFPSRKVAVFIHGCFWHRHGCENSHKPKTNRRFWENKIASNVRRDGIIVKDLAEEGWKTIIIWECETERDPLGCVARIERDAFSRNT